MFGISARRKVLFIVNFDSLVYSFCSVLRITHLATCFAARSAVVQLFPMARDHDIVLTLAIHCRLVDGVTPRQHRLDAAIASDAGARAYSSFSA